MHLNMSDQSVPVNKNLSFEFSVELKPRKFYYTFQYFDLKNSEIFNSNFLYFSVEDF